MNKKGQEVLNAVLIVMLVFTVFSIGFMTESMEFKEHKSWDGLMVVSGMVVLGSVLDTVAEGEDELIISTKDGNYYLIEKKRGYWYYKYTNARVNSNNMDNGFNYYKLSEFPAAYEVKTGTPFYNGITGMAVGLKMIGGFNE